MPPLDQMRVYQHARTACAAAYRLAAAIPDAALRDQMRRAAASVVLNIAEGRGRSSDADFARFLAIARGSNTELDAQLAFAADIGHLDPDAAQKLRAELATCGRMISTLIHRLRAG